MHKFTKQVDVSVMKRAKQLTTTNLTFLNAALQPTLNPDKIACATEEDESGESVLRLMTAADWRELCRILEICAIAGPK